MKPTMLFPAVVAVMLCGCATPTDSSIGLNLLGDPSPVTAAQRTIVIRPDTKYVNVTGGEIVKFIVGEKQFAWSFDGPDNVFAVDLRRAAPPGVLERRVLAYVAPNPFYRDQ